MEGVVSDCGGRLPPRWGPAQPRPGQGWQGRRLEEHLFTSPTLAPRTGHLCYKNAPGLLERDTAVATWLTEATLQPHWAAGWRLPKQKQPSDIFI